MKEPKNIYFRARKKAAKYNPALHSRENAAELLGISGSTLADYELGITKVVPNDKVVLMADLYRAPELKTSYCKHECPIGKSYPLATEIDSIEGITLRILRELNADKVAWLKSELINIAADGKIDEAEKAALSKIIAQLDRMLVAIVELKLAGEKILKGLPL